MTTAHPFQLRSDYWADASARRAFKEFMGQVFGMDFDPWDAAGYWDNEYRPFSFFSADGRVVANACLYSTRLVIAGRRVRVGQISSMAVLPELRRQGLGRQLAEAALRWASDHGHEFFMLFAPRGSLLHYIPSLDVAVQFRRRDGTVTLSDVVGSRMPAFAQLSPFLITPGDREVLFWFMTDSLGDLAPFGSLEHRALVGNNLHFRGDCPVAGPFVMPFSAQA